MALGLLFLKMSCVCETTFSSLKSSKNCRGNLLINIDGFAKGNNGKETRKYGSAIHLRNGKVSDKPEPRSRTEREAKNEIHIEFDRKRNFGRSTAMVQLNLSYTRGAK